MLNYLKFILENLNLKFHKFFLNIVFTLITANFKLYFKLFNCKGLKILINGKIGVSGSAKTKNISIKCGKSSTNNKGYND